MEALAGTIGNRAMAQLLARQPTATQAGTPQKTMPITSFEPTREEVLAAEAWVLFIAQRGLTARPTQPLPDRYASGLENLNVRSGEDVTTSTTNRSLRPSRC